MADEKANYIEKYTLTTANDSETYSYRNPKSWHLYGSNNGTSWTQIDTVTDSGIEAKIQNLIHMKQIFRKVISII